ncbi:uncharacterized protein LOC129762947 [Toxorhynchites rutilus septentrionalis]|uniref:uncharacterized protein LOC129762947 n=1 Tax=Toxorhynchites rutilus septentrionalis TaxID=329112 RepID=UPI00247A33A0|nr:uncharacterized protein LOC129762947 [Toxorhynchites rutilus septentrionalis]
MGKVNFCKISTRLVALLLLLLFGVAASSPLLQETEDPITVPAIQFLSKTAGQDICTAYQVRGQLFVTSAHCLGGDHSAIQQLTALDVVGQGTRDIQAFAVRGPEAEVGADIALVMYDGPVFATETESESVMPDGGGFVAAFGLGPLERFEREGDEVDGAAAAIGLNWRLTGSVLALFGSMTLVK